MKQAWHIEDLFPQTKSTTRRNVTQQSAQTSKRDPMRNDDGFTFIELSVVMAIIGLLALIALPQYSAYRERAYNTQAIGDLKKVAAAQEAFFADNQAYKAISECNQVDSSSKCQIQGLPGISQLSKGVSLSLQTSSTGFVATARHYKAAKTCSWDSTKGGLIGCS